MTEQGLNYLSTYSNLTCLKLGYCKALTDAVLMNLTKGCPQLTELDLSYCNALSSLVLIQSLALLPHLLDLNLRGYQTDISTLRHPTLETLNLSWCKTIDDPMLTSLAKGCPNLVSLDLAWVPNITGSAIHSLAAVCPSLRSLNLRGCNGVSMLTIQYLCGASVVIYR